MSAAPSLAQLVVGGWVLVIGGQHRAVLLRITHPVRLVRARASSSRPSRSAHHPGWLERSEGPAACPPCELCWSLPRWSPAL
jgi:hypothetical protein